MFNWFRRKKENKEEKKTTPAVETQPEAKKEEPEKKVSLSKGDLGGSTATIDNQQALEWAKAAARNIKKQKQQEAIAESQTDVEEAPTESETTVESTSVEEKPLEQETAEEKPVAEAETETKNVPAWMQKSDRLEVLKETAIEEEEKIRPARTFDDSGYGLFFLFSGSPFSLSKSQEWRMSNCDRRWGKPNVIPRINPNFLFSRDDGGRWAL